MSTYRKETIKTETVLFFRIDDPLKREKLKIQGQICDLIVFYCQGNNKILCLTESKGNDVKHAIDQILNTYNTLQKQFSKTHNSQIIWKAYIYSHGSAPKSRKNRKKGKQAKQDDPYEQLRKTFGERFQVSHKPDMGVFFRKHD